MESATKMFIRARESVVRDTPMFGPAERGFEPLHEDERHVAEFWPAWSAGAEPLGIAYEIVVETDGPVDLAGLIERVRARA